VFTTLEVVSGGIRNELLLKLPHRERSFILERAVEVEVPLTRPLMEPGVVMTAAYFPNTAMISILNVMSEGKNVEVGLVGREGFVGLSLLAGFRTSSHRVNIQAGGTLLKIEAAALEESLERCPQLEKVLLQYGQKMALQVAHTAACNRLHDVEFRLARWLLMSHDRVDSDTLPLTQDFLAGMLGTRRSSVSFAAGMLQKRGIIEYVRGRIQILNRTALEAASCECYGQMQAQLATWDSEILA
jgi:CRP-like cAMP-binding protein